MTLHNSHTASDLFGREDRAQPSAQDLGTRRAVFSRDGRESDLAGQTAVVGIKIAGMNGVMECQPWKRSLF
jgi:hypothetical protein